MWDAMRRTKKEKQKLIVTMLSVFVTIRSFYGLWCASLSSDCKHPMSFDGDLLEDDSRNSPNDIAFKLKSI